jgi:DNA-binding transcriptional ArsR family regulator
MPRFKKYEKGRVEKRIKEALTRHKKEEQDYNRKRILELLNKLGKATFEELLEHAKVSRATLTKHLKNLVNTKNAEKVYDAEKGRVVYRTTPKSRAELQVEGMKEYLGVVATYQIIGQLVNTPSPIKLQTQLARYRKALEKSESSFKTELFDYLEKKYPWVI